MPSLPTRKKVAAYARVSMETERLQHSLSAQVSYYSELIQSNPEWEYAGVYADVYNQRLIPFDTKMAVQTIKITAFEDKNACRKPLFLFLGFMLFDCRVHQCTQLIRGGCICTQAN